METTVFSVVFLAVTECLARVLADITPDSKRVEIGVTVFVQRTVRLYANRQVFITNGYFDLKN